MGKFIDLTGQKFGRLTVIKRVKKHEDSRTLWQCCCCCGNTTIVDARHLKNGHTQSCGCLKKDFCQETLVRFGGVNKKHGLHGSRLYRILDGMKQRCYNTNDDSYKHYGGRGITICAEWLDKENGFMNFYNWAMANGYNDTLSIDRIDNDKGYSADNCRWATKQEQTDNRRCVKTFTYKGVTYKSVAEASRQLGITESALKYRAKKENGD